MPVPSLPLSTAPLARAPERRGLLALGLCGVGAVIGGALVWWLALPSGSPVPPVVVASAASPVGGLASPSLLSTPATEPAVVASVAGSMLASSPSSVVVVDVKGRVRRPGVVELPAGSRVIDALDAAGGVTARGSTDGLNLAAVLTDGISVVVLGPHQAPLVPPPAPGAVSTAGASGASGPVDLNEATLEQLDALPGIGPVLAERILQWRAEHGRFGSVGELREVSGIGDATYADLEPLVRV